MKSLFFTVIFIICLAPLCQADDKDDLVDISIEGLYYGDTILAGYPYRIGISIANDSALYGMGLSFLLYSPTGNVAWEWRDVGGYGASGALTVPETCRMYPPNTIWDRGGFYVEEVNMDGILPDTIYFGGSTYGPGMAPGPIEQMVTLHGIARISLENDPQILCIDSTFIPPSGDFVFLNANWVRQTPAVAWNPGGRCYPVSINPCNAPHTEDNIYSEAIEATISQTATTAQPIQWFFPYEIGSIQIHNITNGTGEAWVTNYDDGSCDIQYTPVYEDAGKTVRVRAAHYDELYCQSWMTDYTLLVHVAPIAAGDMNTDGEVNISDAVFLLNYIFRNDLAPLDLACTDVNADCAINIGDVAYLVRYIIAGGPAPVCSSCAK